MSKRHICFYSNKDKWSKAFLEELAQTPWKREFEFICVDPSPSRPNLPKWLKQVPTLVIQGDEVPIKTDTEVMNWLYTRKMLEAPKKQTTPGSSQTQAVVSGEPLAWVDNEMSGMGNAGYSYLESNTNTDGNGGELIPGAFTYLNGQSAPGDRQSNSMQQSIQSQSSKSKKEALFDQQLDLYKQQRDFGMPRGPARQ
jgi:hypothetical protein